MPPLPAAPGAARVRFTGFDTTSGSTGGCRIFVSNGIEEGFTLSDVEAIAAAFLTNTSAGPLWNLGPMMSTAWEWSSCVVEDLTSSSAPSIEETGSVPGRYAQPALPPQCTVALSWTIARRYRGGKPRTYIPSIPTSAVAGEGTAKLTSAYMTIAETAADSFQTVIGEISGLSAPVFGVNVSYYDGGALRISPVIDPIIGIAVHGRLDSQRRRSGKESAFPVG